MADIGEIRSRITLNTKDFSTKIEKVKKQTKTANVEVEDLRNAFMGLSVAMGAVVASSVAVAAQFEQSMAKVRSVTGATSEEFDKLKNKAAELGSTTAFSASQVSEGMNYLAMAGFETNEILASMEGVLNLAAAGQMNLARTSDIASNVLTGFQLSADETNRVVDTMAATMTSSNTNIEQLGFAMKYVAPIASQVGMSVEETAAAVGKLSDAGIQGQQAGTALRAILVRLIDPPKEAQKALDELGVSVQNAEGQIKSLPTIISSVESAFSGMSEAQRTQAAAQIAGTEAASGFLTLISEGGNELDTFSRKLSESGGRAEELAGDQMDTLNGSIKELRSALEAVGITIGEEFAPAVRGVAETLTKVALGFEGMDGATQKAIVTFTTLVPLLGSVVTGFYAVRTAAIALQMSVPILAAITLGVSALAGSFVYLSNSVDDNTESVNKNFDKTQNLTREYDALKRKVDELGEDTHEARIAKERMSQIMETLRDLSPEVVQAYDNETSAVNKLTNALARNKREQISNLKAKLTAKRSELESIQEDAAQDSGRSIMGSTFNPNAELQKTRISELQKQISDAERAYNALIYNQYADERMSADKALERVETDTSITSKDYGDVDSSTSGSYSGSSSSSSNEDRKKTPSEIAHEQYRAERRKLRHKRTMNKLTLDEEKAKLEKLRKSYGKYADIRMELDEEIYRVENEMKSQSYEESIKAIEDEERTMLENGKSAVQVAEMKQDAYARLAEKYGENTQYMERIERNLHQTKMTLLREEERKRKEVINEAEQQRTDFIDGQKRKLEDLKNEEVDSINERKQAELDAIDERRRKINDYYDEQMDEIDEEEYAEERKKLEEQIQKFKFSTSRDGQQKLAELKEKMRRMDREEERRQLREEKEDKLDALDEEERNIESHYDEMLDVVSNYNGNRVAVFASTNEVILEDIKAFVDDYNAELSRMKKTQDTPVGSQDGVYSGGEYSEKDDFEYTDDVDTDDVTFVKDGKTYTWREYALARTYGGLEYHTGGIAGMQNFASGEGLMPNEVASILERGEVVMTPKQIESLVGGRGGGTTNNYYGPLIGHDGDVKLEDEADVSTYWREREIAAQRLMSEGVR